MSALVRNGIIKPDGTFNPECRSHHIIDVNNQGRCFHLTAVQAEGDVRQVAFYQSDVCALRFAKGAVAAGEGGRVYLLFIDPTEKGGSWPYSQRKVQRLVERVCKKAGLRVRNPHDLRHT